MENKIKDILKTITKDYYGANYYNEEEAKATYRIIINQSPFRYYGNNHQKQTELFENNIKKEFNVKYVHCVNSGTGALACALHAFDVTIGDEVIVPGYFWVSVANTVIQRGAFPVLCEIDDTFTIDAHDLEKKITEKTKCLILIHMDGAMAEINKIRQICDKNNVKILEDFSQCIGGNYYAGKIGSFGDISIASLQVNKIITSGEGGLILTNSKKLYNIVVARSELGFSRKESQEDGEGYMTIGEGRRFNEISAAIMNIQLGKMPHIIQEMRNNKAYIKSTLGDIAPIKFRRQVFAEGEIATTLMMVFEKKSDTDMFVNIYRKEFAEDELRLYILKDFGCHVYYNCENLVKKVEALPSGWPWNLTTKEYHYEKGTLPKTDDILERTVGMKLPGNLTQEQINAIGISLKSLVEKYKNVRSECI